MSSRSSYHLEQFALLITKSIKPRPRLISLPRYCHKTPEPLVLRSELFRLLSVLRESASCKLFVSSPFWNRQVGRWTFTKFSFPRIRILLEGRDLFPSEDGHSLLISSVFLRDASSPPPRISRISRLIEVYTVF